MKKVLSYVLSLVMTITTLPLAAFAVKADASFTSENIPSAITQTNNDASILYEDTERRSEYAKHYRLSDGSYVAVQYSEPVHTLDKNDKWVDIDNTLTPEQGASADDFDGYTNENGIFDVKFAADPSDNILFQIGDEENTLAFSLSENISPSAQVSVDDNEACVSSPATIDEITAPAGLNAGIRYNDVLNNVDIEYTVTPGGVKENIVISTRADEYRFKFTLDTDGLTPVLGNDGCVYIGEKYVIPAPVMYDDDKDFSRDVYYELEENDGLYTLTVVADKNWINAAERVFPVVVDPIIKYNSNKFSFVDSEVSEAYPNKNHNGNMFPIVGIGRNGHSRLYINLTADPNIGKYSIVTSAQMTIKTMGAAYGPLTLCARPVESAWSGETITWNNQPVIGDRILECVVCPSTESTFTFDITETVKDWVENGSSNGFVLMAADEDGAVNNATLYSREYGGSEAPQFVVTYRDQSGLHDEYSYTEFSAGNAGSAHVNNYNGSIIFTREDLASNSPVMPVNISHIYDSHFSDEQLGVGFGWRLSVQETITSESVGDKSFFVYTNEQGNRIYMDFVVEEGKFIDHDGLGYSYDMKTMPYELKTPYGTTKTFYQTTSSTWFIKDETDSNGKKISYTYNSDNQLTSITDGSGNTVSLSYSNGLLTSMSTGGHTLTYSYSGGYFTSVSDNYLSTGSCSYDYNSSGFLSRASDQLGQTVEFSYTSGRISGANWYVQNGNDHVASNECSFTISGHSTAVIYAGNDGVMDTDDDITYNYSFDNSGTVILEYIQNADGETVHTAAYSENTELNSLGLKFGTVSEVGYVSESPKFVDSFENGVWNAENGASVSAESGYHLYGIQSMKAVFSGAGQRVSNYYIVNAGVTYTFSVYVKIPTTMDGVRLCIMDISYNELATSEKLTSTTKYAEDTWIRLSLDYTATDSIAKCLALVSEGSGTVYADAAMLEVKTPLTPSVFTEINERFANGNSGWSPFYTNTVSLYQNSLRLKGILDNNVESSKSVQLNSSLDHGYILSGWAKADSLPITEENGRKFELFANVTYYDKNNTLHTDSSFTLPFNWECREWQYVSGSVIIPADAVKVSSITVGVRYANNLNYALFDNIILTHGDAVIEQPQTDTQLTEIKDNLDRIIQVKDSGGNIIRSYTYHGTTETVATEKHYENGNEIAVYSYDESGVLSSALERAYDETTNEVVSTILSLYNADGSISSVTESDDNDVYVTTYAYSDGKLISVTKTKNETTVSVEEYEYDSEGNQTTSSITIGGKKLKNPSSNTSGNVTSVTDSRDNVTTYSYVNGLLSAQTNASGIATRYTYTNGRITSQYLDEDMNEAFTQGEKRVQFYYDNYGRISHFISDNWSYYGYNYNEAGLLSSVVIANKTLVEFEYNPAYTQLIGYTYGNITKTYEYDIYGNLIAIKHNDVLRYSFKYNCLGLLESVYDANTGITRTYVFDTAGNEWSFRENSDYYNLERFTTTLAGSFMLVYSIDNTDYWYYPSSNDDEDVSSYGFPGGTITSNTDDFGRLSSYNISGSGSSSVVNSTYEYETWTDSENNLRTSELVSKFSVNGKTYTYTYDENRNITSVSVNGVLKETYTYDAAGQLIRNDSATQNKSITYTYNYHSGNVSKITEYAYTLGDLGSEVSSKTFSYNAAIDTMIRYNGVSISYDASGNPTSWRDGMTFAWEGRELSSATVGGKTYQYFYNADGIRTRMIEKTPGIWYIHDYILEGTKIIAEKISVYYYLADILGNQSIIVYIYDENDSPIGLKYDGSYYYYTKNLQGDITGIVNVIYGNPLVEYTYDAWGNLLSTTGSMADTLGAANLFRYRGYVYDTATGLYYLQSRYYDPQCGRFVNPDDVSYLGASGTVLGWNLFTYCENDPVNYVDTDGYRRRQPGVSFKRRAKQNKKLWEIITAPTKHSIYEKHSKVFSIINAPLTDAMLYNGLFGNGKSTEKINKLLRSQLYKSNILKKYIEKVFRDETKNFTVKKSVYNVKKPVPTNLVFEYNNCKTSADIDLSLSVHNNDLFLSYQLLGTSNYKGEKEWVYAVTVRLKDHYNYTEIKFDNLISIYGNLFTSAQFLGLIEPYQVDVTIHFVVCVYYSSKSIKII